VGEASPPDFAATVLRPRIAIQNCVKLGQPGQTAAPHADPGPRPERAQDKVKIENVWLSIVGGPHGRCVVSLAVLGRALGNAEMKSIPINVTLAIVPLGPHGVIAQLHVAKD